MAFFIGEINVSQNNIPFDLTHFVSVRCIRFFFCFIQYFKYTFCTGHCGHDHIHLVSQFCQRSCKLFGIDDKVRDRSQCHSAADYHQYATHSNNDSISHIIQCSHNRANGAGKNFGFYTDIQQFFIQSIKFFDFFFFAAEYLYDLLPGNDFFDMAIQIAKTFLFGFKILSGVFCDPFCSYHHNRNSYNCSNGQRNAQIYHHKESTNDGQNALQDLRNTVVQHLGNVINVVCYTAHQFPVGRFIKVTQRKTLEFIKDLSA